MLIILDTYQKAEQENKNIQVALFKLRHISKTRKENENTSIVRLKIFAFCKSTLDVHD